MSANDSSTLIDTPAASKLGENRALYYSEEENRIEKFRPYGLPEAGVAGAGRDRFAARPRPEHVGQPGRQRRRSRSARDRRNRPTATVDEVVDPPVEVL